MGDKVMPQKKSDQDAAAAAPTGHQAATGTAQRTPLLAPTTMTGHWMPPTPLSLARGIVNGCCFAVSLYLHSKRRKGDSIG